MSLGEARRGWRCEALSSVGGEGGAARTIAANQLEVAVLDRRRIGRTFRRITGAALTALLDGDAGGRRRQAGRRRAETPTGRRPTEAHKPTTSAGSADLEGQPRRSRKHRTPERAAEEPRPRRSVTRDSRRWKVDRSVRPLRAASSKIVQGSGQDPPDSVDVRRRWASGGDEPE